MSIAADSIASAARAIAAISGLTMDAGALLDDALLLAESFPGQSDFDDAVDSTVRAIGQLIDGKVDIALLKYDFAGWQSFHFQHRVEQGAKADCRIVFKPVDGGIEVKGFGHRHVPEDLYRRLRDTRND